MNTLQIAYKILYSLEHKKRADYMGQIISPAALDIPEEEWIDVLQMLLERGVYFWCKDREGYSREPIC